MDEADGVVLASPVYSWAVSGQFKVFVDRLSYIMHRPRFHGKQALVLATGMLDTKEVVGYLAKVAQFWGFEVAARAGLITPPTVPARRQETNERILARGADSFSGPSLRGGRPPAPGRSSCSTAHARSSTSSGTRRRSITGTGRSGDGSSPVPVSHQRAGEPCPLSDRPYRGAPGMAPDPDGLRTVSTRMSAGWRRT